MNFLKKLFQRFFPKFFKSEPAPVVVPAAPSTPTVVPAPVVAPTLPTTPPTPIYVPPQGPAKAEAPVPSEPIHWGDHLKPWVHAYLDSKAYYSEPLVAGKSYRVRFANTNGEVVVVILDDAAVQIESAVFPAGIGEVTFKAPKDGVYVFHVLYKGATGQAVVDYIPYG